MLLFEAIVKSSISLVVVDPSNLEPKGYGSGCIVGYLNRFFLLSVDHVANIEKSAVLIQTNLPPQGLQSSMYSAGSMCRFKEFKIIDFPNNYSSEDVDITFCEIKDSLKLLQPKVTVMDITIEGLKEIINFEFVGNPVNKKKYGFYGNINNRFNGASLLSEPKLEFPLTYKSSSGRYHIFNTMSKIQREKDYEGCSGAPILGEDGEIIGLVASVNPHSNLLFAFSIKECKKLLDISIKSGML
jgi:hypothetical protein